MLGSRPPRVAFFFREYHHREKKGKGKQPRTPQSEKENASYSGPSEMELLIVKVVETNLREQDCPVLKNMVWVCAKECSLLGTK